MSQISFNLQSLIRNISVFTEVLPVIFYLIFYKRIDDKSLRVIFFLLISNIVVDLYGLYRLTYDLNNFVSYNVNVLVETTALFIFLYQILQSKVVRKTIVFISVFFFVFWLYQFSAKGNRTFLDSCTTVENISFLAFALYYYYEQLIKGSSAFVYQEPRFWIITAYLIFIAGTFFLLLYLPSLSTKDQLKYYVLNYGFVLIRTILLSIAMFMKHNNSQKQKFTLT